MAKAVVDRLQQESILVTRKCTTKVDYIVAHGISTTINDKKTLLLEVIILCLKMKAVIFQKVRKKCLISFLRRIFTSVSGH